MIGREGFAVEAADKTAYPAFFIHPKAGFTRMVTKKGSLAAPFFIGCRGGYSPKPCMKLRLLFSTVFFPRSMGKRLSMRWRR